jgi:hypothetical protein
VLLRRVALMTALAASLGIVASASAAPPVFSAGQVLATGGQDAVVAMGAAGDAIVAWSGVSGGIYMTRRDAVGSAFTAPVCVADDRAVEQTLRIARNDRGDVALAWMPAPAVLDGYNVDPLRLVVAEAGRGVGAVEDVPAAPRDPVVVANIVSPLQVSSGPRLALGADGTAAVGFRDADRAADSDRAIVAMRPPGGPIGPAQVLGRRAISPPELAADGLGRLHALWPATPPGAPANAARLAYVAEALPGTSFGPPRAISDPALDASNGAAAPQLAANRAGAVIAIWNGGRPGQLFPDRVDVALRPAGGDWPVPQLVSRPGASALRATAALNDRGDAVAAWTVGDSIATAFRPAGGAFGSQFDASVPVASIEEMPMAIDALGVTLIVRRVDAQHDERIGALLRRRGGAAENDVDVSRRGIPVSPPAVATDPYGNGLVVWTALGPGNGSVVAAAYSALPPVLDGLRVGTRQFRFSVSEAARLRITVKRSGRGAAASQTAVVRAGAARLTFTNAVKRALRRPGRYTATIRTRDAGPRAGTVKIRFRRR